MNIALFLVSVLFFVGRIFITPRLDLPTTEGIYESFAHLFVGGLFGAWLVGRKISYYMVRSLDWLMMAILLSAFELIMFFLQKYGVI